MTTHEGVITRSALDPLRRPPFNRVSCASGQTGSTYVTWGLGVCQDSLVKSEESLKTNENTFIIRLIAQINYSHGSYFAMQQATPQIKVHKATKQIDTRLAREYFIEQ